ncbi:p-hydroxyphenylacetate 3-hydroxylase, oxygenase component [Paenibacillus plantiphilus]|uniref:p-hydroxyphenylacetate 3-hydroxylase, oxygenase component n=1 Tax=Paenibacillus plantiphilus TaxID=2905650 RepID=A0ABN8GPP6_9BACL|nr:acyl-CoA dehydrogenase family protein [Paenibacillus plantiphilus]CAH1214662.1 p-hydroxyphenylacetate 3-hydroxylase, oxygenase component [Paenibacillus plantiphilus]
MTNLSTECQLTALEQQLLNNAAELVPYLQKLGTIIDEERHIPDEVFQKISDAGLFKLGTPKEYGGYDVSIRAMVEIVSEVSKGNGSVGWVVQIINGNNYNASLSLPSDVLDSINNQVEEIRFCSVLLARKAVVKKVDGGYLVEEGFWGFGSGSKQATHALLNLKDGKSMQEGKAMEMMLAVVPMSEVTIVDDWYTMSLKGSASNSLELKNVFIPDQYVITQEMHQGGALPAQLKRRDRYRPYAQLIISITTGISAILGLARGAVEYFVEKAPNKGISMTVHTSQAAVGHIQYKVGLAAMKVESAHLHISRTIDNLERHVQKTEPFRLKEMAQLQTDMTYAAMLCWEAVDLLMAESGGSVIADSNRLSQIFRDIRGGSNHALTTASTGLELYGRVLMGLPPQHVMTLGAARGRGT